MGICSSSPNADGKAESKGGEQKTHERIGLESLIPFFNPKAPVGKRELTIPVDKLTFGQIFRDKVLWDEFRRFTTKNYAEENILFLDDLALLNEYFFSKLSRHEEAEGAQLYVERQELIDKYIRVESPLEINIPIHVRASIIKKFDDPDYNFDKIDATLFIEARNHIYSLLERNFYPQFVEYYKEKFQKYAGDQKTEKKTVVVCGGGAAGISVARHLAYLYKDYVNIILVDPKSYFQLRANTPFLYSRDPELFFDKTAETTFRKFSDILEGVEVMTGEVRFVEDNYVIVNYDKVRYDYLVIATGAHYPMAIVPTSSSLAHRLKQLKFEAKQLQKEKRVLIVGGGLVAAELACEIKFTYPDKDVVIIHSHDQFCQKLVKMHGDKIHTNLSKHFKKLGIKYMLNTRVMDLDADTDRFRIKNVESGEITLLEGEGFKVLWCGGTRPNSGLMMAHFPETLNDNKTVKVDKFFRVIGTKNIFALGDVCDYPMAKTTTGALKQSPFVCHNVMNEVLGKNDLKAMPDAVREVDYVLGLGPRYGFVFLGNLHRFAMLVGMTPEFSERALIWKKIFLEKVLIKDFDGSPTRYCKLLDSDYKTAHQLLQNEHGKAIELNFDTYEKLHNEDGKKFEAWVDLHRSSGTSKSSRTGRSSKKRRRRRRSSRSRSSHTGVSTTGVSMGGSESHLSAA